LLLSYYISIYKEESKVLKALNKTAQGFNPVKNEYNKPIWRDFLLKIMTNCKQELS